ncbi:Thiol-disulfide oxidoreductase ResA [Pedobacter sp. Bi36]|nr:Thiol-disulfide oxidoreductase ResA [Pedobacter sp. Bi36]CAH0292996.1 Thiol-disulfide oxidoreductase ResA [Pedobacter sp. Bi126]
MAALCLFFKAYGLSLPNQDIKPLAIGDKVPEIVFAKILNGAKQPISLSSLKGKAVILDFWATWCSSCISAFPKMYGYQKEYAKNLQVILVGDAETDSEEDLTSFLAKRVGSKDEIVLPVASHDKLTTALFPHRAFPHYVWIGADRRVKAITSSSMVSKQNLENFIAGRDIYVKTKEY